MKALIAILLLIIPIGCFSQEYFIPIPVGLTVGSSGVTVINTGYVRGISTGSVSTPDVSITGANAVYVMISGLSGALSVFNITDNQSNTFTLVRYDEAGTSPNFLGTAVYRCYNPTTSATYHISTTNTFTSISFVATAGGTPIIDQQNGKTTGGGTTITAGSITPTANNTIILFVVNNFLDTGTPTTPTSFTLIGANGWDGTGTKSYCHLFCYRILAVAAASNPSTSVASQSFQEASQVNAK